MDLHCFVCIFIMAVVIHVTFGYYVTFRLPFLSRHARTHDVHYVGAMGPCHRSDILDLG